MGEFILRPPLPHPKSLRRATRAQRREYNRVRAEEWETALRRGWVVDMGTDWEQLLMDNVGESWLWMPILGQLNSFSDAVFDHGDVPQLETAVERLEELADDDDDAYRGLVAALRKLLTCWRAEPGLKLYWYGD
ncbi:MAG: hypothetical protein HOZ81_02705 [Streptomyces sp.]|nr:hypothetical protein [Streptomyces sp.]